MTREMAALIARLEELARKATPGEWRYSVDEDDGAHVVWEHCWGPRPPCFSLAKNGDYFSRDLEFIAAANPETILKLCACADVLAELIDALPSAEFMEGRGLKEAKLLIKARSAIAALKARP